MGIKSKKAIETELLLLQYRRGESGALEELIAKWNRPLFYFIRRFVDKEEDAWDVLQEIWIKVIQQIRQLRDPAAFITWIYRIAHNTAISQYRKECRFEPLPEDDDIAELQIEEHLQFDDMDVLDLHKALSLLSLSHREVITLHFLEDFDIQEIAAITDTSPGTIKSRLHYAKRALRELFDKKEKQEGECHA